LSGEFRRIWNAAQRSRWPPEKRYVRQRTDDLAADGYGAEEVSKRRAAP